MDETRIINPDLQEYLDMDINVRPALLHDFIGQGRVKDNLKIFIDATLVRNESLDHVLISGPPGLGKTTLSQIIAHELGSQIKITAGPAITKSGDLAAILTNLEARDILFIDEIHRLNITVEEILYSAMEDFKLDIILGEGPAARALRIDLPKFTLVGATTRFGLLSNPLRDRFGINLQMDFYTIAELQTIIFRTAKILNIKILPDGALEIAKRSRGTPRIANRLLKRVRDFLTLSHKEIVDKDIADETLYRLGVDNKGLDTIDLKYLKSIADFYDGGPVGIDTISAMLSESKDTIEDVVEPYLLQQGFIIRTPKGRILTENSFLHLNLKPRRLL